MPLYGHVTRKSRNVRTAALLLLMTLLSPTVASATQNPAKLDPEVRQLREKIDKVFPPARKAGKAIIIVSMLGLAQKYPDQQALLDNLADEVTDSGTSAAIESSMALEWANVTQPGNMFVVGQNLGYPTIGLQGHLYSFSGPRNLDYFVFVVEPGTYTMRNISYPKPRTTLAQGHGRMEKHGSGTIGELRLVASSMNETRIEQRWHNGSTSTVAAREECNWWYKGVCTQSTYTPEQKVQTRAPGYYPTPVPVPVAALDVGIRIDADLASFDVAPGEVLLVDGIFPEPLESEMGIGACRKGEAMHVCPIYSLELTRAAASLDDIRSFNFSAVGLPRLGKMVGNIQHRPLRVNARSIAKGSFGERLRVEARN